MCLYSRLINNPKYKSNKKNGGNIPILTDERIKLVPIGCGKCIECKKQKSRNWQTRLMEDLKAYHNAKFITLTFNDESIKNIINQITIYTNEKKIEMPTGYNLDNEIAIYATRHFLERYRKKNTTSLRHWLVTELGHNGTENIHLHGIIWTNKTKDEIEKTWQYGFMWQGNYVNEKTINYIIKYIYKQDFKHKGYNSIILTSPGIGNNYTNKQIGDWQNNKFKENNTNETYKTRQGNKTSLPIYYKNKIYSEEQREKLWIQKLDKQERWVLGQKIDISNNQKQYEKALTYARKKNTKLGYGGDTLTWEQEQYERQRRQIMHETRIQKAKNKTPNAGEAKNLKLK